MYSIRALSPYYYDDDTKAEIAAQDGMTTAKRLPIHSLYTYSFLHLHLLDTLTTWRRQQHLRASQLSSTLRIWLARMIQQRQKSCIVRYCQRKQVSFLGSSSFRCHVVLVGGIASHYSDQLMSSAVSFVSGAVLIVDDEESLRCQEQALIKLGALYRDHK